ncbi:uncharacterized protein LOC131626849 [Vicia villosa]|uniref:uncharacterized protein LOC131626849 n=1 Tax=Vicia villosa TaxID=3911 RepID=UPI00273CF28A|nr:uncharacterized protein LOC131626849 [Vicia villosa]
MGEVHDESDDDSEDENFQYDSALEVSFEDESDDYDDIDENELADLISYDSDGKSSGKKKHMKDTGECKGSDNDSDDLQSGCDSDDSSGINRKKYPLYKEKKNMSNYKWELGMYFTSKSDIKDAVISYAVQNGRDLKFIKNDKKRVRVRCKDGCQWELYCSKLPDEDSWQVRKIIDEHNCSREYNVKLLSTKWLSKRIQNSLKNNPRLKVKDIKEKALRKWNVGINKTKAIRARVAARDKVDGSFLGDYNRIYDYCHELLKANQGSTIKMNVDPVPEGVDDQRPYFKRLYICYAACKESFKLSRHVIGLDGCFLKGLCGGQILAAIGRDPNDQMLPIAYAVVESENKDSWTWFLELLIADLGGADECLTYTFISDQQKGLLPATDELLPNAEQRFCVRHLYNNFRKRFPGKMLKEVIWKAAKSTYAQAWEREVKRMRLANAEAYLHMMKTPPRFWSRSYFRTTNKCDAVLNNMSESFNSVILDSRGKPLVTMLEEIRTYLMERWAKSRMRFQDVSGNEILPNIRKKLEITSNFTNMWLARMADEHIFEVRHLENPAEIFSVNLKDLRCSCRRWELTGLPCVHAMASMKSRNFKVDDYIPDYYRVSAYKAVYKHVLYPMNGSNLWVRTPYPDVQPPKYRKMPGRPKKRRNLEQGEIDGSDKKMRRTGFIIKCFRCKKVGHNKLTCKVTPPAQPSQATVTNTSQPSQATVTNTGKPTSTQVPATQSSASTQAYMSATQSSRGKQVTGQCSRGNAGNNQSSKVDGKLQKLGVRRPFVALV